ncbi:MAG: FMN-binding glutamate synthase family protein [Gammaproteobacteria bacterium]|nr:FMN-binding glutamate synthase family protein [Gammaproteobacteria bacterium]MBL6999801.1 FMN-binding glutamate synthase family protein [Gammaproteobacteria bacterium]
MEKVIENLSNWLHVTLIFLAAMLIIGLISLVVYIAVIYVIDVTQTKQAIRKNYPVIGRFRYFFEHAGEFFRQYFFAMDREEMPFNRAQRSWVYRAAKGIDNTIAFGSTRDIRKPGSVLFVNSPYPTLGEDSVPPREITIGENCRVPYTTSSLFNISGMSFGALSEPAILALSSGAAKAGIWLNTGEGGLSPYHLTGHCDIVFQIGTAKNGVRDLEGNLNDDKLKQVAAHPEVRMFEIKLSQGAKPGKGGILPAEKVTQEIANIRGIEAGKAAISPNRHYDIKSDEDLLKMIHRIRQVTGKPVGFKAVLGSALWINSLCIVIKEKGLEYAPDFITLDSAEGGTGAAPMALMDDMGLPLRETLPILVDVLTEYDLRKHIKIIVAGKLVTPADVAWALCMGADFISTARGFMFALGCIQALQCNKNTCPTGITTHNKKLQRGLEPAAKAERVASYAKQMVYEVGVIAHACGVKQPRELNRGHARVVNDLGLSVPLYELHPDKKPL